MSISHKTSVISLNLIKQDLTNEVSIAMIEDAIILIKEAEATEKALTPPTVDEVCAKLSEYLEEQITYESGSFFNERKTAEVCAIGNLGLIYFNVHLPLNIASDIIKFYEGEMK